VETPLEELPALLLALPPSMRNLDFRHYSKFLHSNAVFQCVAEGGLRQLEHVRIHLDVLNLQKVAAWQERLASCAPWIDARVKE
jgi:hypothetical protein